jgi:hypothetical protein
LSAPERAALAVDGLPADERELARCRTSLAQQLGPERFAAAESAGRALPIDAALQQVRVLA